jgi:hypothetical protein
MTKHRCNDPRCSGFDSAALYRRVKKYGAVFVNAYEEDPMTSYTIGLYANYGLPELVMWFDRGYSIEEAQEVMVSVFQGFLDSVGATFPKAAPKHVASPRIPKTLPIAAGHAIPIATDRKTGETVSVYLWPEDAVQVRPLRTAMGQAAGYYRDVHITPFEYVPVWLVSYRPFVP